MAISYLTYWCAITQDNRIGPANITTRSFLFLRELPYVPSLVLGTFRKVPIRFYLFFRALFLPFLSLVFLYSFFIFCFFFVLLGFLFLLLRNIVCFSVKQIQNFEIYKKYSAFQKSACGLKKSLEL